MLGPAAFGQVAEVCACAKTDVMPSSWKSSVCSCLCLGLPQLDRLQKYAHVQKQILCLQAGRCALRIMYKRAQPAAVCAWASCIGIKAAEVCACAKTDNLLSSWKSWACSCLCLGLLQLNRLQKYAHALKQILCLQAGRARPAAVCAWACRSWTGCRSLSTGPSRLKLMG